MCHPDRLLVLGAAGSGTTTLGRALAAPLGVPHHDLDEVLWRATDPPYTTLNPPAERARLLDHALGDTPAWVLSGSPGAWCDFVRPRLALAVFLRTATDVRLRRLEAREAARFGPAVAPGGSRHAEHAAFLAWAAAYDAGPTTGRSLAAHETWLATLDAPVVRLDGAGPLDDLVADVLAALRP